MAAARPQPRASSLVNCGSTSRDGGSVPAGAQCWLGPCWGRQGWSIWSRNKFVSELMFTLVSVWTFKEETTQFVFVFGRRNSSVSMRTAVLCLKLIEVLGSLVDKRHLKSMEVCQSDGSNRAQKYRQRFAVSLQGLVAVLEHNQPLALGLVLRRSGALVG